VPVSASRRLATRRPAVALLALTLVFAGVMGAGVAGAQPADLGALEARLGELNDQADAAVEDYLEAKLALKKADSTLASLRSRSGEAQDVLDSYKGNLDRRAAYAYIYGPGMELDSFLDTDDPAEAAERVQLLNILSQRDSTLIDGIRASQSTVSELLAEAARARDAQAKQVARLEDKKAEIEKKVKETERVVARLRSERRARNLPDPSAPPSGGYGPPPPVSGRAGAAVRYAHAQLGKPYQYGADGPGSFDCSGLTMMAWAAAGVSLPHSSRAQYSATRRVSKANLAPGDLIFRGYNGSISHVSLYIGGGKSITAPQTGDVVKIQDAFTSRDFGYGRP
jgi:peptidoglycan DL-endopeptidase CwlO